MATPGRWIPHRSVFEVRYDYGYEYLDRCGMILNELLGQHPGWRVSDPDPQGGRVCNEDIGGTFVFNALKLDLAFQQTETVAEMPPSSEIAELSASFANLVITNIPGAQVTRIGYRLWLLHSGTKTLEKARQMVKDLSIVQEKSLSALGLDRLEEVSVTLRGVRDEDIETRIAITPVEQNVSIDPATLKQAGAVPHGLPRDQKHALLQRERARKLIASYPQFAILFDTDSAVLYPKQEICTASAMEDLITTCYDWSVEAVARIFEGGPTR